MFQKLFQMFSGSSNYQNISASDLAELASKGKINLIDVRTAGEYKSGYIAGAKNIDIMDPNFAHKVSTLDKEKPYYVYCRSGGRSASACQAMAKQGFSELYNLSGGVMSWRGELKR